MRSNESNKTGSVSNGADILHQCHTCECVFTCLEYYQQHRKDHAQAEGVKLLTCAHCTYVSDNSFHYNWHIMSHASQRPHRCDICAADMCNGNGDGQHNEQQIGDAWSSTYGNTFGNGSASNMTSISDTIFGFGKRSIATQSSEDLIYPTSPPPPYHNHVQHDKFESIDNTDQVEDDDLTDVDEATYDEEQFNGAEQTTDEEDNHAAQTYQTDCDNQHEQLDYFQQSQFQTEQLTNIDHDVDHEIQNGEETEDVEVQQQQQIFHYYNREVDGVDDDDDDNCAIENDGTSNLIMNNGQQEQTYSGQQQEEYTVTENGNEILSDIELFEENVGETNEYENVPVENNHVEHQQLDDDGITNQTKSTDIYDFNSDDDGPTMTNQPMAQIANGCIIQQQQQQQTTSNSLTTQPTHTIQLQSYIHPHQSHIAHHPQQQIATHPHHQPPVPHQNNRNHHPQAFQLPPHMTTGNHPQFITINPSHGSTPFATTTHTAGSGNFQLDTFAANGQTIRLVSISTAFNSQQQGAQQLPHQHQTTTNVTPHLHPLQTQHQQQQQQQQQLQLSELSTNQTPNPTKKRSSKKAKQADNVLVQPQVSANTIQNSSTDQANLSSDNLNNTIGLPIIPFVPTKGKGKGNRKPRINFISVIDGITVGADGVRRKFHCSHCGNGKSFKTKSHLQRHMLTHTGEKPYQCNECGAKFNQSSSLRNHIIAIHTKKFPHTCTICHKGFLMPAVLQKHIQQTGHQSEMPPMGPTTPNGTPIVDCDDSNNVLDSSSIDQSSSTYYEELKDGDDGDDNYDETDDVMDDEDFDQTNNNVIEEEHEHQQQTHSNQPIFVFSNSNG